jgi:hypothetical protein
VHHSRRVRAARAKATGVLSSLRTPVRRNQDCLPLSVLSILLILLLVALSAIGQDVGSSDASATLGQAVEQLADRVVSIANLRGPLRVQYFEDGAFAAETGKDWQDAFRKLLEKSRLAVTEDASANLLRVGLAETPTDVVLSAGVRVNEKEEVRFVTLPRRALVIANVPVSPIRVDQQLVYQSADRILDATFTADEAGPGLAILANRTAGLAVLRVDGGGEIKQTIVLAGSGVRASRDNDGEIMVGSDGGTAALAGKVCAFTWNTSQDVSCHTAKPGRRGAPELRPRCGDGTWKLLADGTDWFAPELLQVIPDGSSRKGSTALLSNFPGPILRVSTGGEQSADSALVVTRNLRTGNYEVYKVTLACGN